ncbi:MAG: hypothetical protein A3E79_08660 [Burkholderiales bacterium RIFCSPHIGHO2_12_FULL_61_11]|nr:MAG: hypothetical protein A3E79_08660 [Burkholderiales bacterium RIFCSPHIGHO2_12_FULL_61_11]
MHFGKESLDVEATKSTGSRRRRIWDLPRQCHCPVVGVCLPLDTLRRLVSKALGGKALADDYEVHVGAVAECGQRGRLSELLQGELDKRYPREVQYFKAAKTTTAVADLWAKAVRQGDVAGAFWAALTHPRCDTVLQEVLCRDMHMLQHQAGASMRIDIAKFNALLEENAILGRELAKVQERSTRVIMEKFSEIEQLTAQLFQVRAENIGKDSRIAFLCDDLTALKASIPGFDTSVRFQKKVEQMTSRQAELEGQNTELRQKLASTGRSLAALNGEASHAAKIDIAERSELRTSPVTVHLHQKMVLCVGGRSGSVASYRDVIERVGGRFAHHDGGLEDSPNVLDASLAAADLVICQTGCISHNAYWKVKDFCKRTGKRCVFVENPSASSLVRGLEQISNNDTDAMKAETTGVSLSGAKG